VVASAGFVLSVDWAWDGAAVVTSGTDGTIRLFDATTHHQIGSSINPSEHGWVFSRVLRDDRLLAMEEQRAWLWDLDPAHWAEQACSVADRQLTESEWRAFLPDRPFEPACGA
jgi:hypothetical protein